eukprot:gene265-517_t
MSVLLGDEWVNVSDDAEVGQGAPPAKKAKRQVYIKYKFEVTIALSFSMEVRIDWLSFPLFSPLPGESPVPSSGSARHKTKRMRRTSSCTDLPSTWSLADQLLGADPGPGTPTRSAKTETQLLNLVFEKRHSAGTPRSRTPSVNGSRTRRPQRALSSPPSFPARQLTSEVGTPGYATPKQTPRRRFSLPKLVCDFANVAASVVGSTPIGRGSVVSEQSETEPEEDTSATVVFECIPENAKHTVTSVMKLIQDMEERHTVQEQLSELDHYFSKREPWMLCEDRRSSTLTPWAGDRITRLQERFNKHSKSLSMAKVFKSEYLFTFLGGHVHDSRKFVFSFPKTSKKYHDMLVEKESKLLVDLRQVRQELSELVQQEEE